MSELFLDSIEYIPVQYHA